MASKINENFSGYKPLQLVKITYNSWPNSSLYHRSLMIGISEEAVASAL
jgi:hypothetical protein